MPPLPSRIAEDLRGVVAGDVLCDDLSRALYATDASLYEITPAAVVRPRVTSDVVAVVRYAVDQGLPIHPRGAGSGLAGGAVGEGIVVDFSRYMRRLLSDDGATVRVQPGLVHAELNRRLAATGRVFGPDPAMTDVTTLGGVVAVDGSGSRRPAYGSARDHVVGLTMVLSDGAVVRFGRGNDKATQPSDEASAEPPHARAPQVAAAVSEVLDVRRDVIREHAPHGCGNGSGYALDLLLAASDASIKGGVDGAAIDLLPLVVGSEGTLGMLTELTLRATPLPNVVGAALLTFTSLERAALAVQAITPLGIAACDLMDRRHVSLARELDPRYEVLLSGAAEAVLYVEVFDDTQSGASERLGRVIDAVRGDAPLAADALVADGPEELRLFSELSRKFVSYLHGLKGNRRATPGVEDITLPPAALPQFFNRLQETLKRRQVTASVFGHAAHGQIHLRPLLDVANPADLRKLETLASELYETVWLLGGSMSGEHGDGLSRTPFTSRQHGPLVNVFREVKRVFDPAGVMNPGKIVPAPGARMTHNTRRQVAARHTADDDPRPQGSAPPLPDTAGDADQGAAATVELQLEWDADEATLAARTCNGCGACRSTGPNVRMCPIFRFTPREEASPRAKANLLRAVLSGRLPADTLVRDDARGVADLCVHCHQCRIDCPAEVDIPRMMVEAKGAHVRTNGLPLDLWWTTRIDAVARQLSRWPTVANRMLASRRLRWLLERLTGLAAGRKLPRLTRRAYLRRAHSRKLDRPPEAGAETVLYFVDTYANYFDAELAEAFERVVKRHGVALYVPQDQLHSGMPMIVQGALDAARDVAERNVSLLAEAIRKGHTVVATEPSAVLALTREYPILLGGDEDALLVAQHTQEACHYLWRRHLAAKLQLDLKPIKLRVAYHQPCHVRALGIGAPAENLLRLIPGLTPTHVERGCSGMAGTFGLLKRNYRSSLRAGLPLLSELREGPYDVGATECGACRTQMEQSTPFATLHPIKLLAASYGVMPEVLNRLPISANSPTST
ncbi:MAG: FAD-binding and (Fe-S)-binding domain-containing protein [Lacipirellulaceae bacterium]